MDEEFAEFLQIFRDESLERLANVSRALEAIGGGDDPATWLEEVDRELHTIKGSSRLLGFEALGRLVHDAEGLVRAWREQPALGLDLIVEVADRLSVMVEQAAAEGEDQVDEELHGRVRAALLEGAAAASSAGAAAEADGGGAAAEPAEPAEADGGPAAARAAAAAAAAAALGLGAAPATGGGGAVAPRPAQERPGAGPAALDPPTSVEGPPLPRAVDPPTSGERAAPGASPREPGTARRRRGKKEGADDGSRGVARLAGADDELVRVRASRLLHLDEIVSDLSLTHLRLNSHQEDLRRLLQSVQEGTADVAEVSQALRTVLHEYSNDALQVQRAAQRLQRLAVDVRLRPVEHLFDHVPREARAVARRLEKKVRVQVQGGETEIDRVILERLKTPLLHLVTNAVDHGLEPPAERTAAGKPEEGTLVVSAGHEGGQVVVRLEDDGRGIDAGRVRALAVQRGVVDAAAAEQLSDEEAIQLIFVPGFSTRQTATEISGRGVGMDVVRDVVESLGGEVRVTSRPGAGTLATIRLPLTLLISRATFVRSGGQQFAIPTESLQESLRIPRRRVTTFADRQAVVLEGRTVPVVRLARLLGHRVLPDPDELSVLVVRHADERLALVIEDLLEERSVVVKPLGWPLELVRGLSGAVHLPTGEVALLLHVPDLFLLSRGAPEATPRREASRRSVLVVDDSIVSRGLVSRYVEALGLDLFTAVDGLDALSVLERVTPDLIVSDVEMPRLDGLGLTRRVRAEERLAGVPVVIISTRGSAADRQAGLEAGADAYLSKSELSEKTFRGLVERLL